MSCCKNEPWPQDRREQLVELTQLLNDITSLNSTTRAVDKLRAVMDRAEHLTELKFDGTHNFVQFLRNLCVGEPLCENTSQTQDEDYDPA